MSQDEENGREKQPDTENAAESCKRAPLSFYDLLIPAKQQALSVHDLLNEKSPVQRPRASVAIRKPKAPAPKTVFQCELPKETLVMTPEKETWRLRCFCDVKMERGFMVQCESCLTWQHSLCVNLNQNTVPAKYQCPICTGKHIRCACEDNMNYRIPLVQCSKCGYWAHRRCECLDPGPYHTAGHVCKLCGGSPNQPPDVKLPYDMFCDNAFVSLTRDVIDRMHPSVLKSPFASVLTDELLGKTVGAFQLCEILYNRFRAFFYLTHPQITFTSQKKRRGDVSFSFFRAVFYVLEFLYRMSQERAVMIFDVLAREDIYVPFSMPTALLPRANTPIELSDPAKDELAKSKHVMEVQPVFPTIAMTNGGIYSTTALQPEQLIGIAGGLVGLVDEFCYDNGVDSQLYVVCGTKFVLDTRKDPPQFIHNFRRSLSPNCVVKLVKISGNFYAGIFAGVSDVNGIAKRTRREKFAIPSNTELMLPIDFAPATIEEPADFMTWHFDEIEVHHDFASSPPAPKQIPQATSPKHSVRPSREEREEAMVIRQVDRTKKGRRQSKQTEKEGKPNKQMKRKPGKPPRNAKHQTETIEASLFSLIRSQNPEPYLFAMPNLEDEQYECMDDGPEVVRETSLPLDEVDCSFIDKMLATAAPDVLPLNVADQVAEMESLVNLDGL